MNPADESNLRATLRRGVYLLLIALAVGHLTGRILAVNAVDKIGLESYLHKQGRSDKLQRPFLSGNDRSRWLTARALVERGTYSIDGLVNEPTWDTIDMVKHDGQGGPAPGPDEGHLYSSKPPLLATLMAAEYWLLHRFTGATLATHPYELGRFMLWTINVLPLIGYLLILARWVERYATNDFTRVFVVAAGALGTFLTTFGIVITNHWPAALGALVALDATLRIMIEGETRRRWFFVAGLGATFAAATELPALALLGLIGAVLLVRFPRPSLTAFAPGVLLVAAASFGTNYAAHGTFIPAYAQRQEGTSWYRYQFRRGERVIDSYWNDRAKRSPVDQGEPQRSTYALHVLVGHHGIFSLTPIWLLSAAGLAIAAARRDVPWRGVAAGILLVSIVCLSFYIARPIDDRNYGGMTSGFRWAFWFAPLWLFGMIPMVDKLAAGKLGRGLAAGLLALSVMSASYPTWNPWVHPWLTNWLLYLDWAKLGG